MDLRDTGKRLTFGSTLQNRIRPLAEKVDAIELPLLLVRQGERRAVEAMKEAPPLRWPNRYEYAPAVARDELQQLFNLRDDRLNQYR